MPRRQQHRQPEAEVFQFDQSDALLRKVMENAAVGMALVGANRKLLYVNGAFAEMLGRDLRACLGADLESLVHAECNAALMQHAGRLLEGEVDDIRLEVRLRHEDGGPIWVLANGSVLASEQTGRPLYVILQVMNIDRQKRAEAALAASESRWNFALEAAGQGVWDHDARTGGMFYSNQWRRMRGIPDDEYVDPSRDKWLARVHPDDIPRIEANVGKQEQGEDGYDSLAYRERHRDGHWVWILSRGRPVEWDAKGRVVRTIGTDTDITRLKRVEAELAEEKERLRVTLESIGEAVISTDARGNVTFLNPAAERMTGWLAADALHRPIQKVMPVVDDDTGRMVDHPAAACLSTGEVTYLEDDVVLIDSDGSRRDIRASAAPLHDQHGTIIGTVVAFQDVTNSRRLQRQLEHSATHDTLTGLPNRAAFEHALRAVADEAVRDQRNHALCFIDLDRFKPVNDTAGHAAGDALLQRVADVIRRTCRRQDFAARIGGDEFAVLLSDCPLANAERVARKIVDAVARIEFVWEGESYTIGASIGLTSINERSHSPVELLSEADAACYVAKANGRGRVAVYQPSTPT